MEASLLAVAPAPMAPQKAASQAGPATDEAAPFTAFLSAARGADEASGEESEGVDGETSPSTPSQQEISMAAELTALSFQDTSALNSIPPVPGQDITTTFTNTTDAESPIIPAPGDFKQFQPMVAANGQTATELAPIATGEKAPTVPNKSETLLTQQLQAILTGDSRDTIVIHAPYQSAPTEPLNTLSSPYLKSAASTPSVAMSAAPAAMLEGAGDGGVKTDTLEGVRQNVDEHYLNAKFESLSDKNNGGNQQQGSGEQGNSANQQNTTMLAASPSNIEQTGQFILTTPGAQTPALTPGNNPVAPPAPYSPGAPLPAEEIITHLVDRFSSNPRLQTSKISLNLNPAELGALKIDIMVKGDSIKAHIIANSLQIQETIEKHMPKLRTILEQQGFTVEDFQVTLESTSSDSNNFFQQQFSSGHDSAPQTTRAQGEASFDLSLNAAEETLNNAPLDSGINLSI